MWITACTSAISDRMEATPPVGSPPPVASDLHGHAAAEMRHRSRRVEPLAPLREGREWGPRPLPLPTLDAAEAPTRVVSRVGLAPSQNE